MKIEALLLFVSLVSGGNADVMAEMQSAIANPPTTPEEVGFYLSGDETEFELIFRKAVTELDNAGYLWAFEDKYINEMLDVWLQNKTLPKKAITKDMKTAMGGFFPDFEDIEVTDELYEFMGREFAGAAEKVEQAFLKKGQRLLSIDIPLGDTLFFLLLPDQDAEKWRNVLFDVTADEQTLAIRDPMWLNYWEMIHYALDIHQEYADPIGLQPLPDLTNVDTLRF